MRARTPSDPALFVRRRGIVRRERLSQAPEALVLADALLDEEALQRLVAAGVEEDHRLVATVEDGLAELAGIVQNPLFPPLRKGAERGFAVFVMDIEEAQLLSLFLPLPGSLDGVFTPKV